MITDRAQIAPAPKNIHSSHFLLRSENQGWRLRLLASPHPAAMAPLRSADFLGHLDATRFLASFWVVTYHLFYLGGPWFGMLSRMLFRVHIAVNWFIALSGFMTHWTQRTRALRSSTGSIGTFYVRRVGRVAATTWLTFAYNIWFVPISYEGRLGDFAECALLVQPWEILWNRTPPRWCANGVMWTIGALLPSWIMYPWVHHTVLGYIRSIASIPTRIAMLVLLMICVWLLVFGPLVGLLIANGGIEMDLFFVFHMWPPCTMPSFAVGCCAAELVVALRGPAESQGAPPAVTEESPLKPAASAPAAEPKPTTATASKAAVDAPPPVRFCSPCVAGLVADACIAALFTTIFLLPIARGEPPVHQEASDYEVLLIHASTPVIATFFVCSTLAAPYEKWRSGILTWGLKHPVLVKLGEYSFVIYLFQDPVLVTFERLAGPLSNGSVLFARGNPTSDSRLCMLYLVTLYTLAAIYCELLEKRIVEGLRLCTAKWAAKPEGDKSQPTKAKAALLAPSSNSSLYGSATNL